ncbi:uncharacterized protein LOC119643784 isoform X1 [Glossina fuscipes]|uniref:Uncharacterized protein LOC119643784 isoform X1 n=1 Tax=Glossina fuscipes TaxID=7396 RepID=A0A9C5ZEW7_9MUSC|nr:uncharacterized protein LOC119643784 isoform X1 [Glossina fuscipes]
MRASMVFRRPEKNYKYKIETQSKCGHYSVSISAFIVPAITSPQTSAISSNVNSWNIQQNVRLLHKPDRIGILIDSSLFFDLKCAGQARLANLSTSKNPYWD